MSDPLIFGLTLIEYIAISLYVLAGNAVGVVLFYDIRAGPTGKALVVIFWPFVVALLLALTVPGAAKEVIESR